MTAYIFAGPTILSEEVRAKADFVFLPPVAHGDVYCVAQAGARAIGLIDGYFEGIPAVWHKEILWAMAQGIPVFGSSSMGALRAAELCAFGMRGIGRIFEGYRDGALEDDDEVAVLHGPAEVNYVALSESMVNIRATLNRAVADNVIAAASCRVFEGRAKELFYKQRTWEVLFAEFEATDITAAEIAALRNWLPQGRVDRKAEDAQAMLTAMTEWLNGEPQPVDVNFDFEWTDAWETAISVSRTVGLDPAAEWKAVPPDRLLDELRLEGDAFRTAMTAALARLLALRGADRQNLTVDRRAVSDALGRLHSTLGLYRRAELDCWLTENDLKAEDLERLMTDEARLEAYASQVEPALDRPLLDHLRISDRYARLADRARRKHTALTALGCPDPKPENLSLTPIQLMLWYFEERLGQAIPDDLDAFARRLGLADRAEFYRLLAREYLFFSGAGRAEESS